MKNKILSCIVLSSMFFAAGCQLIEPRDIISPNVDEDSYLNGSNIMLSWRNGMERDFATTISRYVELTEIVSDNYFNDYSQSSKVFDRPFLDYNDIDLTELQRLSAKLRESADYGIHKVAPKDPLTTSDDIYKLKFIRAYSFLLAGEYFTGLPLYERGEVKDWQTNLNQAIIEFKAILSSATDSNEKASLNLLISRAYYRLGDKTNAVNYAEQALSESNDFVRFVKFDGKNGVNNSIQTYVFANPWFEPLPRLDFLDPKYFSLASNPTEQRSIAIAKAEEAYLIIAEAHLIDNDPQSAVDNLKKVLGLVNSRPKITVNDGTETRGVGMYVLYPNNKDYRVSASPTDTLRSGLVLTRSKSEPFVTIPYISGTSVTEHIIDQTASISNDELLELIYLMRQEIFFAEARRMSDLGIRFPVCFKEASVNPSASSFIQAQIPEFIPLDQDMDKFTMDADNKTVIIKYNMNEIIVKNKNSEFVVPFIK